MLRFPRHVRNGSLIKTRTLNGEITVKFNLEMTGSTVGLRYRSLILLAAFTSLRWAELAALTRADIDLDARTVRVTRQLYYHEKGFKFGPPKSKAGVRTVPFPELIVPDLRDHLQWVPFPVSLVFCSSTGTPLSHSNFR